MKLKDEFGSSKLALEFFDSDFDFAEETEGEWVHVILGLYNEACVLEIKVDHVVNNVISSEHEVKDSFLKVFPPKHQGENVNPNLGSSTSFYALLSQMKKAMSELQYPIHANLSAAVSGKRGIICESVLLESKELALMCGGANEKHRADQLLKCLLVVRDSPSEQLIGLPTTRKLALKNKIVFGTGDYWRAPTLTANMAFVRAVAQIGMSLFTIELSLRALTGN
ncbi:hypothetical protein PVK06_026757 [Gossypium arboreum]|uniref:DUF1308 domain-containing protein n=1 Tax=Gossypium arboreum TaxID=29729 RepID=A0ABR0NYI7_GOSAR|nr:hypothetical protein PVK06_026757 [Gossypium arboreum]